MSAVRWKLADFLEEHGLSAYRLAETLTKRARAPTVYRLAKRGREPSRVDLTSLTMVIEGLRELTGKDVNVQDLLEYNAEEQTKLKAPPAWQALAGLWDDPESPGDVAARHDHYLDLAAQEDLARKRELLEPARASERLIE